MLIACDWTKKYCSSASRPVKPPPVGLSRLGSTARPRSLRSSSTKRRLRIGSVLAVPSARSWLTVERASLAALMPVSRGAAEAAHRGSRRVRERTQALQQLGQVGRGAAQVAQRRRLQPGGRAEIGERRAQLAQEAGQLVDRRAQRARAAGRDLRRRARLAHEARDVTTVAGDPDERAVGVARELVDRAPVGVEDAEHPVGLAQRRNRPTQRRLQVLAARAQARSQLAEDQPEALARGAAQDVQHEVGRDRPGGLLRPGSCAARDRASCPDRSPCSTRRSAIAA